MTKTPNGLRRLYNNPEFWRGALTVRQADMVVSDGVASPASVWHGEAAARVQFLMQAAGTDQDVTLLPEFQRWETLGGFAASDQQAKGRG